MKSDSEKSSAPLRKVTIYTDGGCSGNPGPGGFGVVLATNEKRRELSGGFRLTTNNRMEIMAVIVGLEALSNPCDVTVVTDSRYVHDTIMKGWAIRWRANGWKRATHEPVINIDLWEKLLALCAIHKVKIEWVKGHAGHPENERCDRLAVAATSQPDKPDDPGYFGKQSALSLPFAAATTNVVSQDASAASDSEERTLGSGKITKEGQKCRKCGNPVERRVPKSKPQPVKAYYYAWYLLCPGCGTMYMVDEAKRSF